MKLNIILPVLCAGLCGVAFGQGRGDANDSPANGPRGGGGPHGPPPIIQALDANHDGIIDKSEIENAPQALRSLLKDGNQDLYIPDLMGPQHGGRGKGGPPTIPVIDALDTNHDGIIEKDEIDNSAASLKTLLKNGADHLTVPDLLGPPPNAKGAPGGNGGSRGQAAGDGSGGRAQAAGDGSGGRGQNQGQGGPGRGGPPPLPPVIQALDTNHDGVIDADEIAHASDSLKTLLKSGSTALAIPDLLGPPPPPRGQNAGQPGHGRGQNAGQDQGNGRDNSQPQAGPGRNQNGPPPEQSGTGANCPAPAGPSQSGTNGQNGAPPPPPPPPE